MTSSVRARLLCRDMHPIGIALGEGFRDLMMKLKVSPQQHAMSQHTHTVVQLNDKHGGILLVLLLLLK